tara:strand:+ start:158 stop:424 length:267 start_codon:yes stop_codon:yes gene_type:complete
MTSREEQLLKALKGMLKVKVRPHDLSDEEIEHIRIAQDAILGVGGSLLFTFEECLREEFLINTQNYPIEYHDLFNKKFNRARKRFEEQ